MRFPLGLPKLAGSVFGLGLAGGLTALFGFSVAGSFGAIDWHPAHLRASNFDPASYFAAGEPAVEHGKMSVRRLGLSAVLLDAPSDNVAISALSGGAERLTGRSDHAALDPAQDPHLQPSTVSLGDRITVVTPDGLSYVYRVTARRGTRAALSKSSAENHSANPDELGQAMPLKADCEALNNLVAGAYCLVIESVTIDPGHRDAVEQKL